MMKGLVTIFFAAVLLVGCGGPKKQEPAPPAPTGAGTASTPPAVAPAQVLKGDPVAGKDEFMTYCSSCHGPDAKGMPHLGKDLVTSQFFSSKTDAELIAYVKRGRPVDDPLNTTGVPMPPKGGNPALQDRQIADIIAYVRTLRHGS
jgi:mono/diheme cytochrome c family protein